MLWFVFLTRFSCFELGVVSEGWLGGACAPRGRVEGVDQASGREGASGECGGGASRRGRQAMTAGRVAGVEVRESGAKTEVPMAHQKWYPL